MATSTHCNAHIAAFLADAKRVNPKFREASSSLRGLIQFLRNNSSNAGVITLAQAKNQCEKPHDRRLAKYDGVLANLVSVWASAKPYPGQEVPIGRLMFRGDSRAPLHIFTYGFSARNGGPLRFREAQQDIDPNTAVAVSPSPYVAANFPLPGNWGPNAFQDATNSPCYVYALYLEQGYHTVGQQISNAMAGAQDALALIYAGEMATHAVPPEHILGAVEVSRTFVWQHIPKPADWISRGTFRFRPQTWVANPAYEGPEKHRFIADLLTGAKRIIDDTQRPFPT